MPKWFDCDGSCRRGKCECGVPAVLGDGQGIRMSMMFADGASGGARFQDGQPVDQAMPQDDDNGQSAYERRISDAWRPGPRPTGSTVKDDAHDSDPTDNGQSAYERRLSDAWKSGPKPADPYGNAVKDGSCRDRPVDDDADNGQAAYEQRLSDAWKHAHCRPADPSAARDGVHSSTTDDNGQAAYEQRLSDAWKLAPKEA